MAKKQTPKPVEMVVHNSTPFPPEEIAGFERIGITVTKWRQRTVTLLQHPTESNKVVSVGTTFDRSMQVIAVEDKSDWATALDYIAHGKVYTSE